MGPGDFLGLGLPVGGEGVGFLGVIVENNRRPSKVGSVDLLEFLSWHVNATIGGA